MTDDIADLFELDEDEADAPLTERAIAEAPAEEAQAEENAVADDEIVETAPSDAPAADEEITAEAETEEVDIGAGAEAQPFVFNAGARASRFVWKIDAEGRFSSISHEFAEAVGAKAAAVEGMGFADVAALFNLDPDGKIRELLGRRDTWSGKTIYWPVEGTSLMVPIDLAALPTYTRSREFDGFRGFGIVRLADATEDPHATGLTFLNGEEADAEALPQPAIEDESHELLAFIDEDDEAAQDAGSIAEDEVPATEADAADDASDVVSAEEQHHDYTPPEFEAPVAAPALEPAYSDKVVHLEERRLRSREGLTAGEQAAFREIGRALAPADAASEEHRETDAEAISAEPTVQDIQQDIDADASESAASETENDDRKTEPAEEDDLFADYVRGEQPAAIRAPADESGSDESRSLRLTSGRRPILPPLWSARPFAPQMP